MRFPLLFCLVFLVSGVYGQSARYARVKLFVEPAAIQKLDIALDHVHTSNEFVIGVFSEYELKNIRAIGLRYEILTDDVTEDYLKNVKNKPFTRTARAECDGTEIVSPLDTITTPQDFTLGTMGGFFKYEEMLAHLDNMAAKYPDLITIKKPIFNSQAVTDYQTHQGRPIYYIKISDNVSQDESSSETQVLYTALHHAREPASLSQLIFYMYYLLENYGKNNWVTHLVNSREMVFVPCVNPDGYIYNQTTNPNGGGMWRKNRRNNGGGSYGVDLNRNYSYQWGVSGASTDPNSDVYRGPSAFSEPENRAIRSLCQQFSFKMAFNYHSHGDLLLFPYGYGNVQAPDHNRYTTLTEEMVAVNEYVNEQSVLLYPAAGDSDDYMYGNTTEKPRIFAMTPEIGDDFWIPQSAILPVCRETLWQNLSMALQADTYPLLKTSAASVDQLTGNLSFTVEARGLNALQNAQLSITSKSAALSVEPAASIGNLSPFQGKTLSIPYEVEEGTPSGTPLSVTCTITFNDGKTIDYAFTFIWKGTGVVEGQPIFEDDFTTLDRWTTSGTWSLTTSDYASSPSCVTDSPAGNYGNYVNMKIDTRQTIDLRNVQSAYLTFRVRWNIEMDDDYLQVSIVRNNVEYSVCGNYSRVNSTGRIVYDGVQNTWVQEQINLSEFLGSQVLLRFRIKSDAGTTADGFYLDDVAVLAVAGSDTQAPTLVSIQPENMTTASVDTDIVFTFSENVVLQENGIVLKKVSDNSTVVAVPSVSGRQVTLTPASLEYSTQYSVSITGTALADLAGNYFAGLSGAEWYFITGPEPDVTVPEIVVFDPLPDATDVSEVQRIKATFSEPVLFSEGVTLTDGADEEVAVDVQVENELTLVITPVQSLLPGSRYSVHIPAGSIEDLHENAFPGLSSVWSFSTTVITSAETENSRQLKVFPNPVRTHAFISLPDNFNLRAIQVTDVTGRASQAAWRKIDDRLLQLDVANHLAPGIYTLRVQSTDRIRVFKLIVE